MGADDGDDGVAAGRPAAATPAAAELTAALEALDQATRNFTSRLGAGQREVERARRDGEEAIRAATPAPVTAVKPSGDATVDPEDSFERKMRAAEIEARAYLEAAKRRADSLVAAMIDAVERDAAQARSAAEEAIRARWERAEVDAARHVESAHAVATQMVAERQRRIAELSDGISDRAVALTAGMDDAERVRARFDAFVAALAATAERIARESAAPIDEPARDRRADTIAA